MKLATKVLEKLKNISAEAGDTSPDKEDGHWHKTSIDISGNGKTIETLPKDVEDHKHEIKNNIAVDSGNGHTHEVIA